MKKIITVLIISLLLCSCNQEHLPILLGNFTSDFIKKMNKSVNSEFTYENMTSNDLLKIVEKDAITNNGQKFSTSIKKSKKTIISIGFDDYLPFIKIDPTNNVFEIDNEQCVRQSEIFIYNLVHIIDEIHLINSKIHINILSPFAFFAFQEPEQKLLDSFLFSLYGIIKDIDTYEYVNVISTYKLSLEEILKEIGKCL